jgi:hypothetical protein
MNIRMTRHGFIAAPVFALSFALATAGASRVVLTADRTEVAVSDTQVFPESLTSTRDGRVIFGSTMKGIIYRSEKGASTAAAWIQPSAGGLQRVLGVFADDAHATLWVCSSPTGTPPTGETAVKAYNLASGAFKASYAFPGGRGLCNDMAVAPDGTMYATDTIGARILRLKPGASALDAWASGPLLGVVDGIAVLADGSVYANTFTTGTLVRVTVDADGAAGPITKLETSRPLVRPDGLRSVGRNAMLMIEGDGHLDEVTIDGDTATIKTLKDGFDGPTAVTLVDDQAFVLEAKLAYQNTPALRGKDPGTFRAIAVPYRAPR